MGLCDKMITLVGKYVAHPSDESDHAVKTICDLLVIFLTGGKRSFIDVIKYALVLLPPPFFRYRTSSSFLRLLIWFELCSSKKKCNYIVTLYDPSSLTVLRFGVRLLNRTRPLIEANESIIDFSTSLISSVSVEMVWKGRPNALLTIFRWSTTASGDIAGAKGCRASSAYVQKPQKFSNAVDKITDRNQI